MIALLILFMCCLEFSLHWLWIKANDDTPFPPERIELAVTMGTILVQMGIGALVMYALLSTNHWDELWYLVFIPLPLYLAAGYPHLRQGVKRRRETQEKLQRIDE